MPIGSYRPPRWLRNAHVQSLLSSMPLRRAAGARAMRRLGASNDEHIIEVEDGVRLQGFHSRVPGITAARYEGGMVVFEVDSGDYQFQVR